MKLSTAMKLGIMATAPTTNHLTFDRDAEGRICASCAIGAAAFAVGIMTPMRFAQGYMTGHFGELGKRFPLLNRKVTSPIRVHGFGSTVGQIASILYESHGWSRERVVDWIESIERVQEPEPVRAVSLVAVGSE